MIIVSKKCVDIIVGEKVSTICYTTCRTRMLAYIVFTVHQAIYVLSYALLVITMLNCYL